MAGKVESVRDGYLEDLPEDITRSVMTIHKMVVSTLRSLLNTNDYKDLKNSSWAMSSIDEFCTMPTNKGEVGSIRVFRKGKVYKCMIQITGHFRNDQYGWIEELLHEIIKRTCVDLKPKIRKQFDFTMINEGEKGEAFEGFSLFPPKKRAEEIWNKLEGRKIKTIKEGAESLSAYSEGAVSDRMKKRINWFKQEYRFQPSRFHPFVGWITVDGVRYMCDINVYDTYAHSPATGKPLYMQNPYDKSHRIKLLRSSGVSAIFTEEGYVIVIDRFSFEKCTTDEIRASLYHEIGHLKYQTSYSSELPENQREERDQFRNNVTDKINHMTRNVKQKNDHINKDEIEADVYSSLHVKNPKSTFGYLKKLYNGTRKANEHFKRKVVTKVIQGGWKDPTMPDEYDRFYRWNKGMSHLKRGTFEVSQLLINEIEENKKKHHTPIIPQEFDQLISPELRDYILQHNMHSSLQIPEKVMNEIHKAVGKLIDTNLHYKKIVNRETLNQKKKEKEAVDNAMQKIKDQKQSLDYDYTFRKKITQGYSGINKPKYMESGELTDEYFESLDQDRGDNCTTTEYAAKKVLGNLSRSIIDHKRKVTQELMNTYSNLITKNLLPSWTNGYRKFQIVLLDEKRVGGEIVAFKIPQMTRDFVSRFVAGRESINGFLHRNPEIILRVTPQVFKTMKHPDDAFYFFRSAVKYYDIRVERYSQQLMTEVMKLGTPMKHLISTTRLSGIVTLPITMLFSFDHVQMNDRNQFSVKKEDINAINQFVKNISSTYGAPEKEKNEIIDGMKKIIQSFTESENFQDFVAFPEELQKLYEGEYDDEQMEIVEMMLYEMCDHQWTPNLSTEVLLESHVKKLKRIPADLVAYISIEAEAIENANDKMMIASYCLGKLEIVEWYIELLEVGSNKYIVPHTKPQLERIRTQLLACYKKIMDTPIPKANRPTVSVDYPKGYEG